MHQWGNPDQSVLKGLLAPGESFQACAFWLCLAEAGLFFLVYLQRLLSYHHFFLSSLSWEPSVPQHNCLETSPHEEFSQLSRKGWKPTGTNKLSFISVKGTLNASAASLLFFFLSLSCLPHPHCM